MPKTKCQLYKERPNIHWQLPNNKILQIKQLSHTNTNLHQSDRADWMASTCFVIQGCDCHSFSFLSFAECFMCFFIWFHFHLWHKMDVHVVTCILPHSFHLKLTARQYDFLRHIPGQGRRLRVASGRPPQAPLLRGPRASGLWVCQAVFSGKLKMLIHAPFKILLQGQIP